jgi:hypothetical protein
MRRPSVRMKASSGDMIYPSSRLIRRPCERKGPMRRGASMMGGNS